MSALWISWRVVLELTRDRRTLAFFVVVPILVMTLIYYAIPEDESANIGVLSRGHHDFLRVNSPQPSNENRT